MDALHIHVSTSVFFSLISDLNVGLRIRIGALTGVAFGTPLTKELFLFP